MHVHAFMHLMLAHASEHLGLVVLAACSCMVTPRGNTKINEWLTQRGHKEHLSSILSLYSDAGEGNYTSV